MGPVKRICVFEHSVMTNFNCACPAIQRGQGLVFCLKVPLDSVLVWASSEGSGETARMRRLAWTFAAHIGDKYQIRLTRSILLSIAFQSTFCTRFVWCTGFVKFCWKKRIQNCISDRGSFMSAHILWNLLKGLGKKIRCEALPGVLSIFPKKFNKFHNTGARMRDSVYHMTLKSHFISKFCTKMSKFLTQFCDRQADVWTDNCGKNNMSPNLEVGKHN